AIAAAAGEPVAGRETRAAFLGVAAALLRGRLDLLHKQVVVRPLDRDLLADELLDRLERERARLVDQADRLAAGAGARGADHAMHVVLGVLGQGPAERA